MTNTLTITEAEETVWEHLGEDAKVAKVNGYWIIGSKAKAAAEGGFGRISPNPLRKSLAKAVEDVR